MIVGAHRISEPSRVSVKEAVFGDDSTSLFLPFNMTWIQLGFSILDVAHRWGEIILFV